MLALHLQATIAQHLEKLLICMGPLLSHAPAYASFGGSMLTISSHSRNCPEGLGLHDLLVDEDRLLCLAHRSLGQDLKNPLANR